MLALFKRLQNEIVMIFQLLYVSRFSFYSSSGVHGVSVFDMTKRGRVRVANLTSRIDPPNSHGKQLCFIFLFLRPPLNISHVV